MALKLFSRDKINKKAVTPQSGEGPATSPRPERRKATVDYRPAPKESLDEDPLWRMFQQERYQVIIRDQDRWGSHPQLADIVEQSVQKLERCLAIVPGGIAVIPKSLTDRAGAEKEEVQVDSYLLGVHAVTGAEFQRFVDDGGYEALEYWPEDIWPHLIEFQDLTDCPGPAHWREGRHDERLADHPVVGVSWFEAQAYAFWSGRRLITEAEWQVAASWSIKSTADIHRRFPWGDAMDNTRCNIWSTRLGQTAPVQAFPNGAAPNQVLQLIGNVWEWTASELVLTDDAGQPVLGEMVMQVIRGGAFDTYFETQATSHFRTGLIALARTNNAGFRCGMDLSAATWMNGE